MWAPTDCAPIPPRGAHTGRPLRAAAVLHVRGAVPETLVAAPMSWRSVVKLVNEVVEIIDENCTGCYRCERVCPTGAIAMKGPRQEALAVLNQEACIGCFRCIDVCADDAIGIADLDPPRRAGTKVKDFDPADIAALCRKTGLAPDQPACLCTGTAVKELAAAALDGAATFEQLALATGVASGCLLYCAVPMRRVLNAQYGEIEEVKGHLRRYDTDLVLSEIPADAADAYPVFALRKEQALAVKRRNQER